jgi:hypothetical protein
VELITYAGGGGGGSADSLAGNPTKAVWWCRRRWLRLVESTTVLIPLLMELASPLVAVAVVLDGLTLAGASHGSNGGSGVVIVRYAKA